MDRVARRRDDRNVTRLDEHPHHMREPLLGADRADDLRLGIEPDAEAPLVQRADLLAQARQAAARRVAMVRRLRGGLAELLDRRRRRGDVRIAEAEVDHVATLAPKLSLQLVDSRKDIRREIVDPSEFQVPHDRRRQHGC